MRSQEELKEASKPYAAEFEQKMREARPRVSVPMALLRLGAADDTLRSAFLEFIDVFPELRSARDIRRHFEMSVGLRRALLPFPVRAGSYAMKVPGAYRVAAAISKWVIYRALAPYFIVKDEGTADMIRKRYAREGAEVILDFLGESVVSDVEADFFFEKYLHGMAHARRESLRIGLGDRPNHIAIKVSSLYPFFNAENYEESKRVAGEKFEVLLRQAQLTNAFPTLDAEHYELDGLIEDIFCETLMKPEFRHVTRVGIAKQAYRKDSFISCMRLVEFARKRGAPFAVRLVKGAYWDTEVALADQKNWPSPVLSEKWKADASFETAFYHLMQNWEYLRVSPATHNPESIAFARLAAKETGALTDQDFAFQVLYGLGESARDVLCKEGLPALVYIPVGDLGTGMSYFARRILENTANEGFLLRFIQSS